MDNINNNKLINNIYNENDDVIFKSDIFDEIERRNYNESITYSPPVSPIKFNNVLININNIHYEIQLISQENNIEIKKPTNSSTDAFKIWSMANIPDSTTIRQIEIYLIEWALKYATLEIDIENKLIKSIKWTTSQNYSCSSTWKAFLSWIICSTSFVNAS
jgi:hypothetical protein